MQVPIYTLHMMTFAEPECFLPERWASKTESVPLAAPDAKVMAVHLLCLWPVSMLRSNPGKQFVHASE